MVSPAQQIERLPDRVWRRGGRVPALYKWNKNRKNPVIKLGSQLARRALLMQVVPTIVDAARAFHINSTVAAVKQAQARGHFGPEDEVVMIVDGSTTRPLRNVRFAGQIIYAENPRGQAAVAEATAWIYSRYFYRSKLFRITGEYQSQIVVRVDGNEIRPNAILSYADKTGWEQMTISNEAPYAVKIERANPDEALYQTWKDARAAGLSNRVSIKFMVPAGPHKTRAGVPIGMPQLTIGRLGDFKSRGPRRKDF